MFGTSVNSCGVAQLFRDHPDEIIKDEDAQGYAHGCEDKNETPGGIKQFQTNTALAAGLKFVYRTIEENGINVITFMTIPS